MGAASGGMGVAVGADGADGVVGSGKAVGSHIAAGSLVGTAVGVEVGGAGVPVGTAVGAAAIGAGGGGGWASSQATDAMASATAMMASANFRADAADRRAPLKAFWKIVKIFAPLARGEGYSYSREIVNRAKANPAHGRGSMRAVWAISSKTGRMASILSAVAANVSMKASPSDRMKYWIWA